MSPPLVHFVGITVSEWFSSARAAPVTVPLKHCPHTAYGPAEVKGAHLFTEGEEVSQTELQTRKFLWKCSNHDSGKVFSS